MSKGKKCSLCKEGNMKRFYVRCYFTGLKFDNANPLGKDQKKQKWEPWGWICDNCTETLVTDDYMKYDWREKKEKQEKIIQELREVEWEFAKYKHEKRKNFYTIKDINKHEGYERRIMMYRFWKIRGEISLHGFLKGLKEGRKISDKYREDDLKRNILTDEQILKKAELIKNKKKLGY